MAILNSLNLLGAPQKSWLNRYVSLILLSSLAGFMTLKGWTNICLFLLLIPAFFYLNQSVAYFKSISDPRWIMPVFIAMSLPVFALLISQGLRHDWIIRSYDGPSRMLLAIPLLFYFIYTKTNFARAIGLAAPITLITTVISIHFHPQILTKWGGRYATTFVDPNSFGTYTVIFTAFCLFNLDTSLQSSKRWFCYQLIGLLAGLYLILGSGTRGSWLALPIIGGVWLFANYRKMSMRFSWIIGLVVLALALFIHLFFPHVFERFLSGFNELLRWENHSELDSSAGIRLSMWKISWQLFLHSPLYGYGDTGFIPHLQDFWINADATQVAKDTIACCGPHNELLANMLRSGALGALSVLCLFFIPLAIFIKNIRHRDTEIQLAAQLGLAYIITVTVCSLSMEVFTLKYTATFYGLMMAGLVGQIANQTNDTTQKISNQSLQNE